jgi:uncharacterized protein DUF4339
MDDDSRALDKGWDGLPSYGSARDADEDVTVSVSTAPGEWLVNTVDSVVVPMSMVEVVEALRAHKLTDRSLVWRTGMQEWQQVDRVPQLKLAARMSPTPSAPPPPVSSGRPPPPKSTQQLLNRRATLPGLPAASSQSQSRPRHQKPPVPRAAVLPPPTSEDTGVIAVYDRPAATISFELAPEPAPQTSPPRPSAPHTLAPTTTDHAPRRPSPARNADLSVVAASQFREIQRSSKRLIWVSSLGSAAVASLITLWLSSSSSPAHSAAQASSSAPLLMTAAAPSAPSVARAKVEPVPAAAEPSAAPPADVTPPKPKARRKARAIARPARVVASGAAPSPDPGTEPNPYDVKLEEDPAPAPAKPAPSEPSSLEATSAAGEPKPISGSTAAGF